MLQSHQTSMTTSPTCTHMAEVNALRTACAHLSQRVVLVMFVYKLMGGMSQPLASTNPSAAQSEDCAHKPSTSMLCAACCIFKSSSCSASLLLSCLLCSADSTCPLLVICSVSHVSTGCTVASSLSASSMSLLSPCLASP